MTVREATIATLSRCRNMNKINQAVEVQNGNQIDARKRKPWPSVKAALSGITGIQRQIGILIPVKSDLRAIQYHFDGGTEDRHFIPYDTRINQADALLFAGATLADDLLSITLAGTQWRISDVLHTLANPITYPVDPVSAGQFRADIIYVDYQGNTNYLKGTEGGTAVAPDAPYKTVLVTTIFVSDSDVAEEPPTVEYPDVQYRRGEGNPTQALGIAGDSYLNTLNGEVWFKDLLVADTATWALRYTPTGGTGRMTFQRDTAPTLIADELVSGDWWYNTLTGQTFQWYDTVWVEIGTSYVHTITGPAGADGADGADGATGVAGTNGVTQDITGKLDILVASTTGVALTFTLDRVYGSKATPETGNLTADITGAKLGVTNIVIHNTGTAPTFDAKFKKLSGSGSYVISVVNYIYCTYIASDEIIYSIQQRT